AYRREPDLRPYLCDVSAEARPIDRQSAVEGHHSPERRSWTEFRPVAAVSDKPALSVDIFHRRLRNRRQNGLPAITRHAALPATKYRLYTERAGRPRSRSGAVLRVRRARFRAADNRTVA